jgi:hypothetical protein
MVAARTARNRRSTDACFQWAFSSLQHSPGAHAYYLAHRGRGHSHFRAIYALANRWVGILHSGLVNGTTYDESVAWTAARDAAALSVGVGGNFSPGISSSSSNTVDAAVRPWPPS